MFWKHCALFKEQYALAFRTEHEVRRITYEKIQELSGQVASGLLYTGLSPGDRIAICGRAGPEWVIAYWAIQLTGCIDVALDPEEKLERHRSVLALTECRALFLGEENLRRPLQEAMPSMHLFDLSWSSGKSNLSDLCRLPERKRKLPLRRLSADPASIVQTRREEEGQNIVLTHSGILSNLARVAEAVPITLKDRLLTLLPLWHTSGRAALHLTFWTGSTLAFPSTGVMEDDLLSLRPTVVLGSVEHFRRLYYRLKEGYHNESSVSLFLRKVYFSWSKMVNQSSVFLETGRMALRSSSSPLHITETLLHAIFYVIGSLLRLPGDIFIGQPLARELGRLKAILVGGQRIPPDLDDFFQTLNIAVLAGYWLSETSHMAASRQLPAPGQSARLLSQTVGPLLRGMELKIKNAGGDDVTHIPGQRGTIFLRGPGIMAGYYKNPVRTAEVLDSNGWLNTRDRGYLKHSGELVID